MDIRLTGVKFGYHTDTVLDIPELEINPGRVTALLGPNGAGKSTLLRLFAGLDRPWQGEIAIGGKAIRSARDAAPLVAYGFQESVFLGGSIRHNLDLALRLRGLDKEERVRRISDLAAAFGFGELLDRRATRVSVGEARRASLARALALRAPVTLLDEPLAALDTPTRLSLIDSLPQLLREYASTTVLVTHDRQEAARLADDIVILIGGKVHLVAPRQAAFSNPPDAETAAFLGYYLLDSESGTIAIAPGSLRPGPGEYGFRLFVDAVLRTPGGHEVLGSVGAARISIALPPGASIPESGTTITISAPASAVLHFDAG